MVNNIHTRHTASIQRRGIPAFGSLRTVWCGNPFAVLWGIVINPLTFINELFSEANFQVVVAILAPLLFLPMVAPRYVLPALPLFALYLTADVPTND
ncbi:MAG: hypothetical protein Ct9H90mP5_07640 [Acidimicrobiaceae bacterium]|nr:MAG: hypothetical protein Ct9H90mP5_07640 [Acidimicrobiaceae bacterium]